MNEIKDVTEDKKDITKRLNRIEGQVKGIKRMVEEEKKCVEILTQIAAVRAAINRVGSIVLEKHYKACILNSLNSDDKESAVEDLTETIQKFLKFID